MSKSKKKQMSSNMGIDKLAKEGGPYKRWALQQRKDFMNLRLDQEQEIRNMYKEMSRDISNQIASGNLKQFDEKRLKAVKAAMKDRIDELDRQLTINFDEYIKANIETGSSYGKQITLDLSSKVNIEKLNKLVIDNAFVKMNEKALDAMWNRTRYGLKLNNRIWNTNKNYRKHIEKILKSGVATGEDCVTVARSIERYVKKGKRTLAKEYPNMMGRMKGRVPKDINYEALRLARTEMTSAYGMGTMKSAQMNPLNRGVRFILSSSHPEYDICDVHCDLDAYGLGKGGYPIESAPIYPFHPNCLCIMTQINEDIDDMVDKLEDWAKNPNKYPELENWYQKNYEEFQFF